jgi:stage II sporulation protein D
MRLARLACFAAILVGGGMVRELRCDDGGGRDVSVALFTTHPIQSVTLTPLALHAWTARCARCAHQPFDKPLHVSGAMEIFAGGTLRVADDAANGGLRSAAGLWHLRANGGRGVDVVLTIPSERYVAAVLSAEAAPDEPEQSLRALAIVARTYALNGRHYASAAGHLAADLCDSTQCQAMLLQPVSAAIEDAVQSTAGETLWFHGSRAEVFFSQHCGGMTEDAGAVWPRLRGTPYLPSRPDPYCLRRDAAAWHAEAPLTSLARIAAGEGWKLPAEIVSARIAERSRSRRALRIAFTGRDGGTAEISASALRFGIGRALGWNQVRSDAYQLGVRHGALVFDGRGHGHGVGLCQAGAAEMAREGKSSRTILGFYFPGTAVRIQPGDDGWQQTQEGAWTIRSVGAVSPTRKAELERAWAEAQRQFPPRHAIAPQIVFAPTTEVFRQRTGQSGWMLASTSGSVIVMQPEAVLRGQESRILRHEMLHLLVEPECHEGTPLWLREGLVEALSGEAGGRAPTLSLGEIEGALQHPESRSMSERAHLAAAARVRALVARYGLPAVRGWLSSGVPVS